MLSRILPALSVSVLFLCPPLVRGGAAELLPEQVFQSARALDAPVANGAFAPGEGAIPAPEFSGVLKVHASPMRTLPVLKEALMKVMPPTRWSKSSTVSGPR